MSWTWYIACDMQFFLLMPVLVENYYMNRKCFWVALGILWASCSLISLIVITTNNISASYFTYDDDYWTVYYEKPWARLPAYLIGTAFGCSYYTYKHEQDMGVGTLSQTNTQQSDEDDAEANIAELPLPNRELETNLIIVIFDKI